MSVPFTTLREIENAPLLLALADGAIKSFVLLAAAVAISFGLRKISSAARHALWAGALAAVLVLPVLSYVLPEWRVPWLPTWQAEPPKVATYNTQVTEPSFEATPEQMPVLISSNGEHWTMGIERSPSTQPSASGLQVQATAQSSRYFLGIWLFGVVVALLPLLAGWWQAARMTRRGRVLNDQAWQALLAETSSGLHLRRTVRLLATPGAVMPFTWGAWRPVVIFPEAAEGWANQRRRLVLLHELGHVQRLDWLTQTLGSLACALYWFNPLAWLAARQLRLEREQACDDLVLRCGEQPRDYAHELLEIAAHSARSRVLNWVAVPVARHSKLEIRLRAILDGTRNRRSLTKAAMLGLLSLVVAVVVPMAMVHGAEAEKSATVVKGLDQPAPSLSGIKPSDQTEPKAVAQPDTQAPSIPDPSLKAYVWSNSAPTAAAGMRLPSSSQLFSASNTQGSLTIHAAPPSPAGPAVVPMPQVAAPAGLSDFVMTGVALPPVVPSNRTTTRMAAPPQTNWTFSSTKSARTGTLSFSASALNAARPYPTAMPQVAAPAGLNDFAVTGIAYPAVVQANPAAASLPLPNNTKLTKWGKLNPVDVMPAVDYSNANVRTILSDIAKRLNLNLILPDSLAGTTSLQLHNVTWQEVFRTVLEPLGYTYTVEGTGPRSVIRIIPKPASPEAANTSPNILDRIYPGMTMAEVNLVLGPANFIMSTGQHAWAGYPMPDGGSVRLMFENGTLAGFIPASGGSPIEFLKYPPGTPTISNGALTLNILDKLSPPAPSNATGSRKAADLAVFNQASTAPRRQIRFESVIVDVPEDLKLDLQDRHDLNSIFTLARSNAQVRVLVNPFAVMTDGVADEIKLSNFGPGNNIALPSYIGPGLLLKLFATAQADGVHYSADYTITPNPDSKNAQPGFIHRTSEGVISDSTPRVVELGAAPGDKRKYVAIFMFTAIKPDKAAASSKQVTTASFVVGAEPDKPEIYWYPYPSTGLPKDLPDVATLKATMETNSAKAAVAPEVKRLKNIYLPSIDIDVPTPLDQVVMTLHTLSIKFDPEGLGVNFLVNRPEQGLLPKVTLAGLTNMTLEQLLDLLCDEAGYTYRLEHGVIVLSTKSAKGSLTFNGTAPLGPPSTYSLPQPDLSGFMFHQSVGTLTLTAKKTSTAAPANTAASTSKTP